MSLEDLLKGEFVTYLVENDIRAENGLKSLEQLKEEYPEEYENFINNK